MPKFYVWNKTPKIWTRRKRGHSDIIGRMYFAQPSENERYTLNLLNVI